MKSISFTVTNDLSQDQRMNRICSSLARSGYNVILIGRKKNNSIALEPMNFDRQRIWCFFQKGKLFYLEYNLKLFFYLLFSKQDAYCAIDLDTILPNYLIARLKGKPLIYDAHEYFTELEEVIDRPITKSIWKFLENWIVPKVDKAYTVSNGYKEMFEAEYNTRFEVIRNATILSGTATSSNNGDYILYQGAVNRGRGLENVILAMKNIDSKLIICGEGDVLEDLKKLVEENDLKKKVEFKGFVQPHDLVEFTRNAKVGLTLFDNAGLSNQFSLANRFFDYMHSCVPQIAMNYPEYNEFNKAFEVAFLIDDISVESISTGLRKLLEDKNYFEQLKNNCLEARKRNCWQEEEKKLIRLYNELFSRA